MDRKRSQRIIKQILKTIALAGCLVVAGQSPYFWHRLVKTYFKNYKQINRQVINSIRYLKYKGHIAVERKSGLTQIKLLPKGYKKLKSLEIYEEIYNMKIKKSKRWDNKWRIVVFDIPKSKNKIRDAFRLRLKELGFFQFQKSIWLYPFECHKEIALMREFFSISPYVKLITTNDLEADNKVLQHFKLFKSSRSKL